MAKRQPAEDPLEPAHLLTAPEVARILNVSRSLIYWLIQRGELPTVRIRRALRFRSEDIQDYIRKRADVLSSQESQAKEKRLRAHKRR
jgi:excisionase family DNA binding protein